MEMIKVVVVFCALSLAFAQTGEMCRVLALAGGGDKGAYQAGAIQGLVASLPAGEAEWDVITGISVGAINALPASRFMKGNETAMAAYLTNFWNNFSSDMFYENWPGLVIQGLISEAGLYNSAPMLQTLNQLTTAGDQFYRHIVVGATDLISGDFIVVNDTYSLSDVVMGTMGSAATPGVLPPVTLDEYYLSDGTTKYPVDILSGVNQCQNMGFDNENILVDVVLCSSANLRAINMNGYKPLQVLIRYLEIMTYDDTMQFIGTAKIDYPNVNIRNVIIPSGVMPDQDPELPVPFNFVSEDLATMVQMGYKDAVAATKTIQYS